MSGGRYSASRQNLTLLQELIKKDPESYKPEFTEQYRHYQQTLKVFQLQPQNMDFAHLQEMVNFISQVAGRYPEESKGFQEELMDVLRVQGANLNPDLRNCFCKALILLRNRNELCPLTFNKFIFENLLKIQDKSLRKFLFTAVISHLRKINVSRGKKNPKLNSQIQSSLFAALKDSHSIVVRTALLILIECFRKHFWQDAKTANAIAQCCFHQVLKIRVTAMKFLLGARKDEEEDKSETDDSEEEVERHEDVKTMKEIMVGFRAGKKTKKRKKAMDRAKQVLEKETRRRRNREKGSTALTALAALQAIYDPQEFVELLFRQLQKCNDRFEVKLIHLMLISRVIGLHKLMLLQFYSYLHRYLQPQQREVTKILLCAAQATHDLVPPDVVGSLLHTVVNNFVTDRNSTEVITVGLNSAREILNNCPLAIDHDLLSDLTQYKKYRNKNVSVAARSLIQLFRGVDPSLLRRRDRGKPTEATTKLHPLVYGQKNPPDFVPGAECLENEQEEQEVEESEEEEDSDGEWADLPGDVEEAPEEDLEDEKEEEEEAEAEKAKTISSGRILSQKEFQQISVHRMQQQINAAPGKGHKRKLKQLELEESAKKQKTAMDELPRLRDIEKLHKRPKEEKQARMQRVEEGREGREKFGRPHGLPHVGRTNKQMMKKKNFGMLKPKVHKGRKKRSFAQKQQALKQYLTKQKKMK